MRLATFFFKLGSIAPIGGARVLRGGGEGGRRAGRLLWWAVRALGTVVFWCWGLAVLALIGAALGDRWKVLGADSFLLGFHYLPPSLLLFLALPAVAAGLLSFTPRWAVGFLAVAAGNFVLLGDYAPSALWAPAPPAVAAGRSLSVTAINVRFHQRGLRKTLAGALRIGADVVLLTENVLRPGQLREAERLVAPYRLLSGRRGESAILTRLPVLSAREVDLPSRQVALNGPDDDTDRKDKPFRSMMHAVVDVGGVATHVIAVRLIAGGGPAEPTVAKVMRWTRHLYGVQQREVDFLLDYLKGLSGPIVFGGDLNAPPNSITIRRIRAVARDARLQRQLLGGFTFPSGGPYMRLDYLFTMNGAQPVGDTVYRRDWDASDHLPVTAQFVVAPPAGGAAAR